MLIFGICVGVGVLLICCCVFVTHRKHPPEHQPQQPSKQLNTVKTASSSAPIKAEKLDHTLEKQMHVSAASEAEPEGEGEGEGAGSLDAEAMIRAATYGSIRAVLERIGPIGAKDGQLEFQLQQGRSAHAHERAGQRAVLQLQAAEGQGQSQGEGEEQEHEEAHSDDDEWEVMEKKPPASASASVNTSSASSYHTAHASLAPAPPHTDTVTNTAQHTFSAHVTVPQNARGGDFIMVPSPPRLDRMGMGAESGSGHLKVQLSPEMAPGDSLHLQIHDDYGA